MKFKESKYYNKEFLGKYLCKRAVDNDEILTVKEFFNINNTQKEYLKEGKNIDNKPYSYKLTVYDDYYELDCQSRNAYLFLVFDKPVHIVGPICSKIIAPEVIIKSIKNTSMFQCVVDKIIINNNYKGNYDINILKANNVYFYNSKIRFFNSEINNLFIFNEKISFNSGSIFLETLKIKAFGKCEDLNKKLLNKKHFEKGIIHIE